MQNIPLHPSDVTLFRIPYPTSCSYAAVTSHLTCFFPRSCFLLKYETNIVTGRSMRKLHMTFEVSFCRVFYRTVGNPPHIHIIGLQHGVTDLSGSIKALCLIRRMANYRWCKSRSPSRYFLVCFFALCHATRA